jgi:CheY-like chemotaxis protein
MSDMPDEQFARTPIVYFVDDSATMREVVKIAFRKANIHVITCADAASAITQFEELPPDAVITDVIMPDKDGYAVCEYVKQHEKFAKTPVILMSGVVNRSVAEKALAVRADELIRKPFQPQDLIARVKKLLDPPSTPVMRGEDLDPVAAAENSNPLRNLFAVAPVAPVNGPAPTSANSPAAMSRSESAVAVADHPPITTPAPWTRPAAQQRSSAASSADVQKLRREIYRLELLVKKLQAELEAQRQYAAALEAHMNTLQENE